MAYKISGTKSETARIMVLKESDWSIESNTVISGSGAYEVDGLEAGAKTVVAESNESEVLAYGNVTASAPADSLPDWLTGFPTGADYFQVVIGTNWQNQNFTTDDVINMYKITGETKWSEDGTETPNSSTNRLLMNLRQWGTDGVYLHWGVVTTGGSFKNIWTSGTAKRQFGTPFLPYAFKEIFDVYPPNGTYFYCDTAYFVTTTIYYKSGVFKSMTYVSV